MASSTMRRYRRRHTIRYNQRPPQPSRRDPIIAYVVATLGALFVTWWLFTWVLKHANSASTPVAAHSWRYTAPGSKGV